MVGLVKLTQQSNIFGGWRSLAQFSYLEFWFIPVGTASPNPSCGGALGIAAPRLSNPLIRRWEVSDSLQLGNAHLSCVPRVGIRPLGEFVWRSPDHSTTLIEANDPKNRFASGCVRMASDSPSGGRRIWPFSLNFNACVFHRLAGRHALCNSQRPCLDARHLRGGHADSRTPRPPYLRSQRQENVMWLKS